MKKYLIGIVTFVSITVLTAMAANAGSTSVGFSLMAGIASTDGTESEKSGDVGPETNKKSINEDFYGGSVYIEHELDNGVAFGLDYVPYDIELGSGTRTDVTTDGDESTQDDGTSTASADLQNLITVYTAIPMGDSPVYGLLGLHNADITSNESLHTNSTYPDAEVWGYQVGLGVKGERVSAELFYSDFEDISLKSTAGSSKIEADADVIGLKIKIRLGTQ